MALDGAPSEPFLARNGALVLAPGGRADAFIDATAQAGSAVEILLHDGSAARSIARLQISAEPPIRPAPLPPAPALPSDGLPAQLDLKGALRVDLALAGPEWVPPANFATSTASAFSRSRQVAPWCWPSPTAPTAPPCSTCTDIISGCSTGSTTAGSRSGWIRWRWNPDRPSASPSPPIIAGRWLVESVGTDWTAPRLVRWYGVG